jgi:hypothetical protein
LISPIDVKCLECNTIYEISKKSILDDFEFGKCPECESKNVKRVWAIGTTDVGAGKHGNSETEYRTTSVYHPSKFGKYKGTQIK